MSLDWSQYTLTELHDNAVQTFRKGGGSRPDVLLIEIDGHQAVLKDQNNADYLFALLIGPILTWRECKALKKLASLDCIPDLLHQPSKRSFLMSYHPSEQITHLSKITADWPVFFQAEDGIRDFCLSRGLGDVYKRQKYIRARATSFAKGLNGIVMQFGKRIL